MKKGEINNLQSFFNPKSIAVIGASANEQKIGTIILRNIERSGYEGDIIVVNKHTTPVGSYRCFNSYDEITFIPELAIIAVPAEAVFELVQSIGVKGTKNIVIISAGFKESNDEGVKREEALHELVKQYELRILGPNCLGFLNATKKLNATFGQVSPQVGNIRFASQSGALATSLFDWATATSVAFSELVTLGNKLSINENDILDYWQSHPKMSFFRARQQRKAGLSPYEPIGLYLESINDAKGFLERARTASMYNPVVLLKPGKSAAAKRAMQSHTGAKAGDSEVLEAALRGTGVIRADGIEDMFDLLRALAWEPAPEGNRVAILSNAGGPAVMATDTIEQYGLTVAQFSKRTEQKLTKILPSAASIHDPIDLLGDALSDRYEEALNLVLAEHNVDAVLVILTPQVMTQVEATAASIVELSARYNKTIFCSFMGGTLVSLGEQILNQAKIPSFRFPERAIRTMSKMIEWKTWQKNKIGAKKTQATVIPAPSMIRINSFVKSVKEERTILTNFEVNEVFKEAGIAVPAYTIAPAIDEAFEFANKRGYPVILKISSSHLLHKTEAGGVIPNITSEKNLLEAYNQISKSLVKFKKEDQDAEIIIEQFVPGGMEVIAGVKRDQNFGNVLLFGAGGIYTELMDDTELRCLPQTKDSIKEMVLTSKIGKVLSGFRGGKTYNIDSLVSMMLRLSQLAEQVPQIAEIEINPIIITESSVFAVDGKAILL